MEHSRKIIHIMPRKRARSWNMTRCLVPALLFLFLLPVLWSFFPTGSRASQDHDPARPANFGVGFDLAPTYGTAAVSYPNGTVRSIIKIDGDASYSEMMARLSLYSSQHLHRPYNYAEGVADLPRRLLRDMRMLLGLPASGDVYTLSKMIKKLHTAAELLIGQPVASAEASIPDFACALYGEDIHEAFNYLGLNFYQFRNWDSYDFMYSSNGAYANYDLHVCSNYTEPDRCWKYTPTPGDPYAGIPWFLLVSYGYTYLESHAYLAAYPIVQTPARFNSTLGYNALQDAPNEEEYWEQFRQYIRSSIGLYLRNVTRLVLTGDAAYIPKFRHVLKEVTDSMWEHELEVFDLEPVFAAARGGAILTMNEIWHRNHPGDDTNMVQEL